MQDVFLLSACTLAFAFLLPADGFAQQDLKSRLVADYLDVAFTSENAQLAKPIAGKNSRIKIVCSAKNGCSSSIELIHSAIVLPGLAVTESASFDPTDLNSVVLYSDFGSDDERLGNYKVPTLQPDQAIYEDGNSACNARVIHRGHLVDSVVVYVDQKMEGKKIVSCVLLELARATGLNVGPKFQKQWEPGGPLFNASIEEFNQSMLGLERLLAIHFQTTTEPGMTKSQVYAALNKLTLKQMTGE